MSYDASFKLKVVAFAEENSNVRAAAHFGVNEKQVCCSSAYNLIFVVKQ